MMDHHILHALAAEWSSACWMLVISCMLFSDHHSYALADLYPVPSPEHGASRSMLSNVSGKTTPKLAPLILDVAVCARPDLLRLVARTVRRLLSMSLDRIHPIVSGCSLAIRSASWILFPPGAAHISSTSACGGISTK